MAGWVNEGPRVEYLAVVCIGNELDVAWWCGQGANVKIEKEGRKYTSLRYSLSDSPEFTSTVTEDSILLSAA